MSADKMHVCWLLLLVLAVRVSSFKQTKGPLVFRQSKIVQKPSLEESSFRTAMVEGSATVVVASGDVTPRPSLWGKILATWGVVGVLSVIGNAVRRLVPVALEPVKNGDLTPFHWSVYIGWTAFMTYTEGYSAFQKKFSPLVVKRAFTLQENPGFFNYLLAGPYSMGLFNATPKRLKVSWNVIQTPTPTPTLTLTLILT